MPTVSKIKTHNSQKWAEEIFFIATYWALSKFSQEQEYAMGFPTIRDQFVYPTIIHYPLFLHPLFVTRHKLVRSLCIPTRAARTWEEKGFVGTWSDGGKGGRVTFQNGGGVSLPSRITKKTFWLSSILTVGNSFTCNKAMFWVHIYILDIPN